MYSKTASLALFLAILGATSAQEYDLYLREAEADPSFKSFVKGVGKDFKAYGQGFGQGFSRRDAEAEAGFGKVVQGIMKAEGRMGGSFVHGLVGRDAEAEYDDFELYTREPGIKQWFQKNGPAIEKGIGGAEAQFIKHLRREAEAEADFDDIYAREAADYDNYALFGRDAKMISPLGIWSKPHIPIRNPINNPLSTMQARDAEPDFDDEFDLYVREAARAKTSSPKPSGSKPSGGRSKYFGGAGTAAINALPGTLQGVGAIMQGAQGQQAPAQKRDAFADPEIFDYEY